MPFCANCGWQYEGAPRFCRDCGRGLYRSPDADRAHLRVVGLAAPPPFDRRVGAACAGLALLAGVAYLVVGAAASPVAASALPLDEAWARLVYARSLAQGARLEFNSGVPDAGVGSLLWVGVLAVLIKTLGALGVGVVAMAKALSLLGGAATAGLSAELTRRLSSSRLAMLAAGTAVALDPSLGFAGASGIETTLFAALLLGSVLAFLAGRSLLCGVLLGLATLARAEGLVLALLIGLVVAAEMVRALRRGDFGPRHEAADEAADDEPSGSDPSAAGPNLGIGAAGPGAAGPDRGTGAAAPGAVADPKRLPATSPAEAADPERGTGGSAFGAPTLGGAAARAVARTGLAVALPIVAVLLWMPVAGPGQLLPRAETGAPQLWPDPIALWSGYVDPWVGLLGAGAWVVAVPVVALGAVGLIRHLGARGLPLLAFPLVLALWNAMALAGQRTPWDAATRQRLDPILPFLVVLFVLGVRELWQQGGTLWERRNPVGSPRRPVWAVGLVMAGLVATSIPLAAELALWRVMPAEYLRAAREIDRTYFALAVEARGVVPEQALIAAVEPGLLRYVSRRPVADLTGAHTPSLAAGGPTEALVEARPEFAALPLGRAFESLPGTTLLRTFPAGAAPGQGIGLFRVTAGGTLSPKDAPVAFAGDDLRRLDYLDVANDASERSHNYQATAAGPAVRRASRVTAQAAVEDDGRPVPEGESFELTAEPGRDLILARRYDGARPGGFRVAVDGQPAGEWFPRDGRYLLAEETIRIPAGLIRRPKVTVALQPAGPARPTSPTTSFAYWAFADR